jgi:carnitine O-acetyltransferase
MPMETLVSTANVSPLPHVCICIADVSDSLMDGTPTIRLNEFILGSLDAGKIPLELPQGEQGKAPLKAEEIKFELDSKVKEIIATSKKGFGEEMQLQDLNVSVIGVWCAKRLGLMDQVVHFEGYGKESIKQFKVSPDAWVQMIKQLAFYSLFSRPGVTYESCQTRRFQLGRTEVIRSCSMEAKQFCEAMLDPKASDQTRDELLRKAASRHIQYAAWAVEGQGVDRHMFGLRKLVREGEEMPQVFKEEVFSKSSHWEMSTSNLSSPWLDGWGYGEGECGGGFVSLLQC